MSRKGEEVETPEVIIESTPSEHVKNSNHALYGGIAGLLASTILHPLEVVKIGIIINPMKLASVEQTNPLKSFMFMGRHIM